ncbi:alcohol dehydrogenase catalytic domain-containing protein [Aurantimicrobium minutum]|uniref:alcohol dehydrogenase catalytic domain-containing protein n=1 Tax=Aurantimicrobium minutum TaxID=708131 RepID=UPI002473B969|nr:alcohol dehydrogenase catalytic domain-containing protein [Aurantimicrobium minutum]MDH6536139.1 threonine dehydrogenase-like Zn-dependent dehydrogenase [Aurantimicrobium minutum]
MLTTFIYGAVDIRVEEVPKPTIKNSTDALIRVVRSCICGSDLHHFHNFPASPSSPKQMGHEFIGVVEEVGSDVASIKNGDFVIAPFAISCGTCEFCRQGLYTSCFSGTFWGRGEIGGAQAEYVLSPFADGTLFAVPGITEDSELLPSLLTLSDVYGTGYHAAKSAHVGPGDDVVVIGDGAVGLLAVLSAQQLGAEKIILMGSHKARTDLGREFGATHVVAERSEAGIAAVRALTHNGLGASKVLEAVGYMPAYEQALGVVRAGGVISRVGVPQYDEAPVGMSSLFGRNITLTGGVAPVRAYIDELLPGILDGSVNPGRVFDSTISIQEVPEGYAAMDQRTALKVMIAF